MKKIKIFGVVLLMAIGVFCLVNGVNNHKTDLLTQNIEALSSGESDCSYVNGYRAFKGGRGGAYDCCRVWVSMTPVYEEACR